MPAAFVKRSCRDECDPRSSMFERCRDVTHCCLDFWKNKKLLEKSKSKDMTQSIRRWHTLVRSWMSL